MKTIHALISWPLSKQHNGRVNWWRLGHLPRRLQVISSRWRCSWPRAPVASTADVWWCVYTADRWTMNCWCDSFKVICYFVLHDTYKNHHTSLALHVISTYNTVRCSVALLQNNFHKFLMKPARYLEWRRSFVTRFILGIFWCSSSMQMYSVLLGLYKQMRCLHFTHIQQQCISGLFYTIHIYSLSALHSKRLTNEECKSL